MESFSLAKSESAFTNRKSREGTHLPRSYRAINVMCVGNLKELSRKSAVGLTKMAGNDRTEWRNLVREWVHQRPPRLRN